jgi:arginase
MNRKISLVINKSEITAGTRGASLGPEAIMTAARASENTFFCNYPKRHVKDMNEMLDAEVKFRTAKRIKGLVSVFESVVEEVGGVLNTDGFPLVLAADHGSAGGTIAAIKSVYKNKRLGVIWIDAHGDLHTPYTTPSGNMHGMPLATALGVDNKACQRNEPTIEVANDWELLKDMGGVTPKINPEDLVFIAVRDTEPEEDHLINELGITNHTVQKVREEGVEAVINETLEQLKECDIIYVSFDVDSMDPELTSHGTGTPVPLGLTPDEAKLFLDAFSAEERLCCLEIVEVNPCLDEKINKMAETTFTLLESLTNVLESK